MVRSNSFSSSGLEPQSILNYTSINRLITSNGFLIQKYIFIRAFVLAILIIDHRFKGKPHGILVSIPHTTQLFSDGTYWKFMTSRAPIYFLIP